MEPSIILLSLTFVLLAHAFFVNAAVKQWTEFDTQNEDFTVTLPPECVGKELCTVKPIDYPTAIMDREAKFLVQRSRRQSSPEPITPQRNSNHCVESIQHIKPFVVVRNGTQHLVVQSSSFNQNVTGVNCRSEGASCFGALIGHDLHSPKFFCKTTYSSMYLTTYNFKLKKPEWFSTTFPVGCACMKNRGRS